VCGSPNQATIDRTGIAEGATVVQGLVYDGDVPLAGGYVRLLDDQGDFVAEVITSATGQFRFYVRAGSWTVRVVPGGGHAGATVEVDVAEAEIAETRITV
jgi:Protein of unknown function (DUF1416)